MLPMRGLATRDISNHKSRAVAYARPHGKYRSPPVESQYLAGRPRVVVGIRIGAVLRRDRPFVVSSRLRAMFDFFLSRRGVVRCRRPAASC